MKKKYPQEEYPVYEIYIEDEDQTGIKLLSLVDDPAIQMKGMMFSSHQTDIKSWDFKAQKDRQIIMGPGMIPNKKILRKDDDGNKYFVVFTKDTIQKMVSKFNANGSNRRINIDHSDEMVDGYIMENWIVEDEYYDKSRKYGFEVPVGTWMVSVKIEDEKIWKEKVKEECKFGFSIEGIMGQKPMSYIREWDMDETIDEMSEDEFLNLFSQVEEEVILEFLKEKGEELKDQNYIDFAEDDDDFLPSQRVWVYKLKSTAEGPFIKENSRDFCRYMHDINRFWQEDDIKSLSVKLYGNERDIFKWFGSYNCRHELKPVILTRNNNPSTRADVSAAPEVPGNFSEIVEEEFKIEPKSGETEREFISRCIPFEINNGYEAKQAAAICYAKLDKGK